MNRHEIKKRLRENLEKQKEFFKSKKSGDLLVYIDYVNQGNIARKTSLARALYRGVLEYKGEYRFPSEKDIRGIVRQYVEEYRESISQEDDPFIDDAIPCIYAHYDIGIQTAAVTGLNPSFSGEHWWLEPNLDWDEIERLDFDPDNEWIQLALLTYRELWRCWDEDFFTMPYIHRSPLDLANGIRGTQLFLEMYTAPEKVKKLADWCVDWQLAVENYMYDNVKIYEGWGTGVLRTWGPDRAVWVNGDPVGLISRAMMREFEQPYTGRLFSSTGGGFFHNHTRGLYQIDQVAKTKGIFAQQFSKDPNCHTIEETLLNDPKQRVNILQASLTTPVLIWASSTRKSVKPEDLDRLLPILREGRFIICVACEDGVHNPYEVINKFETVP